jgi:hypothetical protein
MDYHKMFFGVKWNLSVELIRIVPAVNSVIIFALLLFPHYQR